MFDTTIGVLVELVVDDDEEDDDIGGVDKVAADGHNDDDTLLQMVVSNMEWAQTIFSDSAFGDDTST